MPTSQPQSKANLEITPAPARKAKPRGQKARKKGKPFAKILAAKCPEELGETRMTIATRQPPQLLYRATRYRQDYEAKYGEKLTFAALLEMALEEKLEKPLAQKAGTPAEPAPTIAALPRDAAAENAAARPVIPPSTRPGILGRIFGRKANVA